MQWWRLYKHERRKRSEKALHVLSLQDRVNRRSDNLVSLERCCFLNYLILAVLSYLKKFIGIQNRQHQVKRVNKKKSKNKWHLLWAVKFVVKFVNDCCKSVYLFPCWIKIKREEKTFLCDSWFYKSDLFVENLLLERYTFKRKPFLLLYSNRHLLILSSI